MRKIIIDDALKVLIYRFLDKNYYLEDSQVYSNNAIDIPINIDDLVDDIVLCFDLPFEKYSEKQYLIVGTFLENWCLSKDKDFETIYWIEQSIHRQHVI